MAKTRGAKSSSPSSRLRAPRETFVQGSIPEPPRPLVVPPSVEDAPLSPPSRRYETRRPPTTPGVSSSRAKKSGSRPPKKKARPSQPPATESQIPSGMTPEVVIRCPMVTQPPIEEKVHRKKLLKADAIPLLFPRLLCQILEHLGYPSEPQLERRRICREIFTLDKWTSMIAYGAEPGAPAGPEHPEIPHPEQPEEPQPVQIPADMRAPAPAMPSTEPILEVAPSTPPATPQTPPVIPSISEPPPSSEPRIVISISEYRGLCHTLQALTTSQSILTQQMTALRAHQEQIIATQTQHTAILRQIQHHLGILLAPEHPIPILSGPIEPSLPPPFVKQTMPSEEPTTREAEASTPSILSSAAEPSSSHHPPATI
ncbi:hypothetical protein AAG906_039565 [Vitis piasezkii]